ncbi:ATP-grasp domain-containing protein [Paenibacillus xerothermodurans]|nr:ATP-grasp domain-containing protein [Paenibacillus xerothermodurans]
MKKLIKVVVTGAGSPGAAGVIKALRKVSDRNIHIIGLDASPTAVGRAMVDRFYHIPEATDQAFTRTVLDICKRESADVILPLVTKELFKFAEHKTLFDNKGTSVSVSDYEKLVIANNKGRLLEELAQAGFDAPRYRIIKTVEELDEAIRELGYPDNPVCFKPTLSNGSRGFRVLDPSKDRALLLFSEKPNSTYISITDLFDVLKHATRIPEMVVMEYLPGQEYSVDLLADQGKVLTAIPRLREAMVGGITTRGVVVHEQPIIDYASQIVNHLGLHGNIGVQVRLDCNNKPKILEINPRIQGTIIHCVGAGVNLPYLAVKLALGIESEPEELAVKWGTRMTRYWEEIFYDVDGFPYSLQ